MSVYDIVCDCLYEENVRGALALIGSGRLIADSEAPEEPYLTPDEGYLIIRVKDYDPILFSRELERRVSNMRIVTVVDRSPKQTLDNTGEDHG